MGVQHSVEYRSDYLYHQIRSTIKILIQEYKFWSDDKICNELEVVYYNKLLQFDIDILADASTAISFTHHNKKINNCSKEELCRRIVNHYQKRIKLLKYIDKSVKRGRHRIAQAIDGPVCQGVDIFVEDFFTCQKIPDAVWISKEQYAKFIARLYKTERFEQYEKYIDKLDYHYHKCIQKLLFIVEKIKKELDKSVSEERFAVIESKAEQLVKHMDNICDIFYILAINYN
jgi:hypothetical protein